MVARRQVEVIPAARRDSSTLTGVRVFTSTTGQFRRELGERITEWIVAEPDVVIRDVRVVQSSDAAFHCLTIVVFYGTRHR